MTATDWDYLEEDVSQHTMMGFHDHGDGRFCMYHSRLASWCFEGDKRCLRDHDSPPYAMKAAANTIPEPTKQREGDQRLPDGDEELVDDQQLLIDDIEQRRQVGIERYGQGHRPFNGRDTLEDLYEEQLDFLVYLRSIKRMHEASKDEVVAEIARTLKTNGFQDIVCYAMAEQVYDRIQGWIAGMFINGGEK